MDFSFNLPVNLIFGRGKADLIGKEAAKYGKKALIVTGGSSAKKSGLLDRAEKLLHAEGVDTVLFDKVTPNPVTYTGIEGAELAKKEKCDVVVALGGGSIMDCAKGIAFLAKNDGDINDYIFNRARSDEALPVVLVATTCGTGSEGNGFAVFTNPENGDKKSLRCNAIIAKSSIIDSCLMETMPKSVLSSVGFDALCHSMEAYMSNIAQPFSTWLSIEAMKMSYAHLPKVAAGSGNADDWDAIALASTIGGMVINTAGVTVPHGMEHPASGLKNIVHGRGLAAITPVVTAHSVKKAPEKYAGISQLLGGKGADDCEERIKAFLESIDLVTTLGEQGISEADIEPLTVSFFRVAQGNLANHPCEFTREEIAEMFRESL